MNKNSITGFLILITASICAQPKIPLKDISKTPLSTELSMGKNVKKAYQWKDGRGSNILVLAETGAVPDQKSQEGGRKAELFAYCFLDGSKTPSWKIYDSEKQCPVDVEAFFVTEAIEVTDLDGDGLSEIWIVYKTTCRGDISGRAMKIIMYENGVKHALRGSEKIVTPEGEFDGGREFDAAFAKAPQSFRDFAVKKWDRFGTVRY